MTMKKPKTSHSDRLLLVLTALAVGVGAGAMQGCNIVGAGYFLLKGPPTVPAQFQLPEGKSVVVFVDDRANRLGRADLRSKIAEAAEQALLNQRRAPDVIDGRAAIIAARGERFGEPMSMVEIGKAVEADLVIWVGIDEFTLSADGTTFVPSSSVRVRVIDVAEGGRLWPTSEDTRAGHPVSLSMPQQQGTAPSTRTEMLMAQDQLASWTGIGVAQLFFKHEARDSRGR